MSEITNLDLWRNGIWIDQNQARTGVLPHHVERLRKVLLDFGYDRPEHLELDSAEDESRRLDYIAKTPMSELEQASFNFYLAQLQAIQRTVDKVEKEGPCNCEPVFSKRFFDTMLLQRGKAGAESGSFCYYTEDLKYTRTSRPWDLFKREGFRQDDRKGLPVPKPDWVSSYTVNQKDHIQENLGHRELQHLAQHGLESNASRISALDERAAYPDRGQDWVCFPWLIVQHGKPGGIEAQCHQEAANASTAAVMMLERLCKFVPAGVQGKENDHVPPVVAVTTVKKVVRVWITYSCKPLFDGAVKFRMVCIWRGDMTAIFDLMELSSILCDAHDWALKQRPRISTFISQWKAQYPMGSRSTETQEQPGTLPELGTSAARLGAGSNSSFLDNMEPRHRGHLLDLLESYRGILEYERRERQRLMAQVDEMQQRLRYFIERRGSSNPSSTPAQPVQQTESQQSSPVEKSTPTEPQPQFTTALNSSSKPNRSILPLRSGRSAVDKQKNKPPQSSSIPPHVFGRGLRVHWPRHPGKTIRIRLPKPTPTLTQTLAPDIKFWLFCGRVLAAVEPATQTPSKSAAPVQCSGTAPAQDKKEKAVLQTTPITSIFSNKTQSTSGGARLFQTGSSTTTSSFSAGGLKPAVSQGLPKFQFVTLPTKAPSQVEQIVVRAFQNTPTFSFGTSPFMPKAGRGAPMSENPLPKFNFAAPLPKVKPPDFIFGFNPLSTSKYETPSFTFAPFSSLPTRDRVPGSRSRLFFSPSTAKDNNTHGFTGFALFSIQPTAKEQDDKTAGSSSAPFSPSPKSVQQPGGGDEKYDAGDDEDEEWETEASDQDDMEEGSGGQRETLIVEENGFRNCGQQFFGKTTLLQQG